MDTPVTLSRLQRRAVARQPHAVGERLEVVADALLVPDAEAL